MRSTHFNGALRRSLTKGLADYLSSTLTISPEGVELDLPAQDIRPELHYQYGFTPPLTERARANADGYHDPVAEFLKRLPEDEVAAISPATGWPDPKGRFLAHVITHRGELPSVDSPGASLQVDPITHVTDDPENIVPARLDRREQDQWRKTISAFGTMMLNVATETAKMIALELGLDREYFLRLTSGAHHKVAPTFASLYHHRRVGEALAVFHQDIDFLSIHLGEARGGLFVYDATGKRCEVTVPDGCFLVQSGRQLSLKLRSMVRTGEIDHEPIEAGWHEVSVTQEVERSVRPYATEIDRIVALQELDESQKLQMIKPLFEECLRISGTFFYHLGDDTSLVYGLHPGCFEEDLFPEGTNVRDYVEKELGLLNMKRSDE